MIKLRPHQIEKSKELLTILNTYKCVYLAGEVRSGKTLTVLETAKLFGAKKVLFVTKKKAISSIQNDFNKGGYTYEIQIINYESIHKVEDRDFDLIIYDEAHGLGAFPKPSQRTRYIKNNFFNTPCIWLSGTPAAESYSQYYHQFWVSVNSPFKKYTTFYKWAHEVVDIQEKRIGTHTVKDYSSIKEDALPILQAILSFYTVIMTQDDAGFETNITETILTVTTPNKIQSLAKRLIKDKAIEGKTGVIFGDLPAKLQSKTHQIYNGSVIIEKDDGTTETIILSHYKAEFIKDHFKDKKIAVMYYYQGELEILKQTFGDDITNCLEEFNSTSKNLAIQQSSTEGMNISKADCLVYLNLGFSGKSYIQSRDRLTVKDRVDNNVYFIVETGGITRNILNAVRNKKNYNLQSFKNDFQ